MRRQYTAKTSLGFTLIEALVVVAIAGILLALGVPSMGVYSNNQKIKAAAGNLAAAVQTARLEAVSRNVPVELVFTSSDPIASNATAPTESRSGPNWIVRAVQLDGSYDFIQGFAGRSMGVTSGGLPVINLYGTAGSGALTAIQFSPLARAIFNPNSGGSTATQVTMQVSNPLGGACQTSNTDGLAMRCLSVVITLGGQARVCDPLVTDVKDTRRCAP